MKPRPRTVSPLALAVTLTAMPFASGCPAKPGYAAELAAEARGHDWMSRVTDGDILRVLLRPPSVELPVVVAIVDSPPRTYRNPWHAAVDGMGLDPFVTMERHGLIEKVVVIQGRVPDIPTMNGEAFEYLKPHRYAAAQRGADVVVVVSGHRGESRWMNPAGLLYLSVVGLWLVPATHHEVTTYVDAVAVDVRDGTLLATASGDATVQRVRPMAILDEDETEEEAWILAYGRMLDRLANALGRAFGSAHHRSERGAGPMLGAPESAPPSDRGRPVVSEGGAS